MLICTIINTQRRAYFTVHQLVQSKIKFQFLTIKVPENALKSCRMITAGPETHGSLNRQFIPELCLPRSMQSSNNVSMISSRCNAMKRHFFISGPVQAYSNTVLLQLLPQPYHCQTAVCLLSAKTPSTHCRSTDRLCRTKF